MEGKVVAITGGSSGMGLELAKLLASRGAKLSICDVVQANLDKAVGEIGLNSAGLHTQLVDVRNLSQVHDWISQTVAKFGKLDGAANMAGIIGKAPGQSPVTEQDEDDWDRIIGINLTGVMHSVKEELKVMKSGASIVNAASTAGLVGIPGHMAYCISKHGVVGLTRVCAQDYGPKGIRVNAVAPGIVETPMMAEIRSKTRDGHVEDSVKQFPIQRPAHPIEIARVIAFLLSDESSFVTGSIYTVDGGWTAH